MDLSLGNNNNVEKDNVTTGGACSSSTSTTSGSIEKEHMFDKVVTPSDVGKLNRLVIPKQHAEKYFPLDSSSVDKGLLLTFEDRLGKPWRFRYSYWNSSQSYVMTKGWSRFVKEKKLDAGDIVSFHRGVGESGRHRLFIDWRHRPIVSDPPALHHHHHINQMPFLHPVAWGNLYSLPRSLSMMPRDQLPQFPPPPNFTSSVQDYPPYHLPQRHLSQQYHHQYHHHHNQQAAAGYGDGNAGTGEQYYLRPAEGMQIGGLGLLHHHQQRGGGDDGHNDDDLPMVNVIHSVPVVHGQTVGKRLRLFGVNMECPIQDDHHQMLSSSPHLPSSSSLHVPPPPPQLTQRVAAAVDAKNSKKGKSTSLSFDLDL